MSICRPSAIGHPTTVVLPFALPRVRTAVVKKKEREEGKQRGIEVYHIISHRIPSHSIAPHPFPSKPRVFPSLSFPPSYFILFHLRGCGYGWIDRSIDCNG